MIPTNPLPCHSEWKICETVFCDGAHVV